MDGFRVIREKAGLIVRQVNHVVGKKVKKEEVIQLVGLQCQCAIAEKVLRRVRNGFLGRKNNYNENF